MKRISWSSLKDRKLRRERDISFREVVARIREGGIIDTINHPDQERYPGQKIHLVEIRDYIYLVPFVENSSGVFLKTVIPSRKATRQYRRRLR